MPGHIEFPCVRTLHEQPLRNRILTWYSFPREAYLLGCRYVQVRGPVRTRALPPHTCYSGRPIIKLSLCRLLICTCGNDSVMHSRNDLRSG
jgi:hypothetical protein